MDLQNKMIKKGYIIPIIIAVIFAVSSLLFFKLGNFNVPFAQDTVMLAVEDNDNIIERSDIQKSDKISRADLGNLEENTLIGSIKLDNADMSVMYNASESVSVNVVSLNPSYKLFGETGVCLCTLTKNNASKLKSIEDGDELTVSTVYSSKNYTLTAQASSYFTSIDEAITLADGLDRAVVLVADTSNGIAVDEKYLAVLFEVSGGADVSA